MCDKEVCDKEVCDKEVCERWCVTKCERGRRTEEAEEEPGGTDLKTRAPHKNAVKKSAGLATSSYIVLASFVRIGSSALSHFLC